MRAARDPLADRLTAAVAEARSAEAQIPDPNLALAIADGSGMDERILHPGQPQEPRRGRTATVPGSPGRHRQVHARRPAAAGWSSLAG